MRALERSSEFWGTVMRRLEPVYDAERQADIDAKYSVEPEIPEWQDIAADDAGVSRFGEL